MGHLTGTRSISFRLQAIAGSRRIAFDVVLNTGCGLDALNPPLFIDVLAWVHVPE